jgi:hypothetical protein
VAAVGWAMLAVSCGRRAPTGVVADETPREAIPGEKTEDEVSAPRPTEEAADLALAKAIDRKICRKRDCCVSGIEDAGTDRKGRSMVVATIDAGEGGVASCLVPPEAEPETFGSEVLDKEPSPLKGQAAAAPDEPASQEDDEDAEDEGGPESGDADARNDCHPYEYYLVVHTKGKIRSRAFLSEACNNAYGAAGVGEDNVSVDKETRTFTHAQEGGSAWRWDNSVTVGLDPLRIVSISDGSFWTIDTDATSRSADWNHDTFEGNESWSIPDCEGRRKQEEAEKRDAAARQDGFASSKSFNALIVPRVQLPAAFVQDGWRSIGIGNCGAFVDGDKHGFAIYGGKGSATDATMRAVVSKEGVLFVEIADDRWTSSGKTWVKEDHLELWLAPAGSTSTEMLCDSPLPPDPSKQWGIRISDGAVFAGFGSPELLAGVEVVRAGHTARARIPLGDRLKDDGAPLTVVYSDSDDGVHQKRLLATSTVDRGQELSLGHVRDVDPAHATCVVKGKTLRINRPPLAIKPGEAVAR